MTFGSYLDHVIVGTAVDCEREGIDCELVEFSDKVEIAGGKESVGIIGGDDLSGSAPAREAVTEIFGGADGYLNILVNDSRVGRDGHRACFLDGRGNGDCIGGNFDFLAGYVALDGDIVDGHGLVVGKGGDCEAEGQGVVINHHAVDVEFKKFLVWSDVVADGLKVGAEYGFLSVKFKRSLHGTAVGAVSGGVE